MKLKELEGRWYINMSNFPMWLKGDKTSPTFNYSETKLRGIWGLSDSVEYIYNGKKKSIKGFDKPLNKENSRFQWRGKGFLRLLSSNWSVEYINREQTIIILAFEKTLFTPEGYDVISRYRELSEEQENTIQRKLTLLNTGKLKKIQQEH
jgi:hypothetical protein